MTCQVDDGLAQVRGSLLKGGLRNLIKVRLETQLANRNRTYQEAIQVFDKNYDARPV